MHIFKENWDKVLIENWNLHKKVFDYYKRRATDYPENTKVYLVEPNGRTKRRESIGDA